MMTSECHGATLRWRLGAAISMLGLAASQLADGIGNGGAGCCFSYAVDDGELAVPCCLRTALAADAAACSSISSLGTHGLKGSTSGFRRGTCPATAEQAALWISDAEPVVHARLELVEPADTSAPTPQGCCYAIGHGELSQPCCLQTTPAIDGKACETAALPLSNAASGASGYSARGCPADAVEAAVWLAAEYLAPTLGCCFAVSRSGPARGMRTWAARDVSACSAAATRSDDGPADVVLRFHPDGCPPNASREALPPLELTTRLRFGGCCFSIAFAEMMRPCCLHTVRVLSRYFCRTGQSTSGMWGYRRGRCPSSALEALGWLEDERQGSGKGPGCCFSYKMSHGRPCCLVVRPVANHSACPVGTDWRYSAGACPMTASAAAYAAQYEAFQRSARLRRPRRFVGVAGVGIFAVVGAAAGALMLMAAGHIHSEADDDGYVQHLT
eukprot:NODE_5973_length_1716_cov_5.875393.p1 GENE.NODE_5973_length_1716_cov_5.875393~~NODE_5973_length_1716_cov_5.875393.p1  ORF type:complete len:444 (-),score=74.09 NODE_5973_length_1716_cov_5.875393:257-1588(-)